MRTKLVLVAVTTALLLGGTGILGAEPADVEVGDIRAVIAKDGTSLRQKPSGLARASGTLPHGAQVRIDEIRGKWIRVAVVEGGTGGGWLRANQTVEPFALTQGGQGGSVTAADGQVSQRDISAAGRQFDPETESSYRKDNPDLEPYYPLVKQIEDTKPTADELRKFVLEGRLGRPDGSE